MGALMSKIAKLRKKARRLKRANLNLIIEANAAMARSGEWQEAYQDLRRSVQVMRPVFDLSTWVPEKLDG